MSSSVKIDLVALARAMEDGAPENRYLLDRQTGQILFLSAKTMTADELLSFKDKVAREPSRYVAVERTPSEEKYRDLEIFVREVKDKKLQGKLVAILSGGNPVRPFLDAVDAHPQEKERWKQFKQARVQRRVEAFLKVNGLL